MIWNHVALLHEIKCEISAQLGEDTAAELVPEDCTAGIAEKLLDAIVECVVSGYMDGDGEGGVAEGQDENMAEELGGALAREMDVDEPDVGSASGHGVYDSEAGPSRVESLYEEHISSMSKSASPKPWTRDTSSEDVQIIDADNVPVHIKGEREDTAELAEIQEMSRSSAGLPRSMSSFSPDIQSQSGVKSKRSRATASRAGGIEASRPVGFEVSPPLAADHLRLDLTVWQQLWKEGALIPWKEVENNDYMRCTYQGIAHENLKRSYYIVRCRNNVNNSVGE